MPVNLQPASMRYKNRGGRFVSVDCIKGDPGSVEDIYATDIEMSIGDPTTIAEAIDDIAPPTGGTAGQYLRKKSGTDYDTEWASPVATLTESSTGKLLDASMGKKLNDEKVAKDQGVGNAGKALGIGNDGMVTPVPFSGEDFTGATASANGVHGYVPAPQAGEQDMVLTGGGTWEISPGAKLVEVTLTPVSNTSGSYSQTTSDERVTADMVAVKLEIGTPATFNDTITITTGAGTVTLSCADVAGTSTAKVYLQKVISDPTQVTSTEFDILANRIGTLANLTTTEKGSIVGAVNEVNTAIANKANKVQYTVTGTTNNYGLLSSGKSISDGPIYAARVSDPTTGLAVVPVQVSTNWQFLVQSVSNGQMVPSVNTSVTIIFEIA